MTNWPAGKNYFVNNPLDVKKYVVITLNSSGTHSTLKVKIHVFLNLSGMVTDIILRNNLLLHNLSQGFEENHETFIQDSQFSKGITLKYQPKFGRSLFFIAPIIETM
jgi:hypothetical protein